MDSVKNEDVAQVHDKGYKELYSNKEVFLDLLQNMLKLDWAKKVSPEDLSLIDTTYVTPDYSELESDIVYRLNMGEQDVIVYVLLEFQSSVDYRMPVRLLFYIVEILREYLKEKMYSKGNTKIHIPAVFPIVLYNGDVPWKAPLSLYEITEHSDLYGENLLNFRYSMLDINHHYTEEDLLSNDCITAMIMLLDQNVEVPVLLKRLEEITQRFRSLGEGKNRQIITNWLDKTVNPVVADYMVAILNAEKGEVAKMVSNLSTVYERGIEKAKMEGLQAGLEKGLKKGAKQKQKEMIAAMAESGLAPDLIAKISKLPPDEVRKLLN